MKTGDIAIITIERVENGWTIQLHTEQKETGARSTNKWVEKNPSGLIRKVEELAEWITLDNEDPDG